MANPPANYRAIPPLESNVLEAGGRSGRGADTRDAILSENLTKWAHFLLGCCIMLPFSALTSQTPFFLSRLAYSPLYPTFSSYLSTVYSTTKLLGIFYCTITSKQSSPSCRIFVSILMSTFFIVFLFFSTFVTGTPRTFFAFALFNTASLALLSSYLCTAVYAQAALLGPPFFQSVLTGQGAVAVVVSGVMVIGAMISLWMSPKPAVSMLMRAHDDVAEDIAARIFFVVSTLFLCTTLGAYTWLTRQPSYNLAIRAVKQQSDAEDELGGLISDDRRRAPTSENLHVYRVLKQNWVLMFSLAYVYTVTLAVFPAITVFVRSVNPAFPPLLFTAVHFLVFTIGDLIGRQTCSFPCFVNWSSKKILAMSLMRTIFVPLVILCNVYRPGTIRLFPPMITSDILFMIILFTMGYTNGLLSCLGLLVVSSLERNPRLQGRREDVDVAATLGGTFLMIGLAAGALSSFSVQAMV